MTRTPSSQEEDRPAHGPTEGAASVLWTRLHRVLRTLNPIALTRRLDSFDRRLSVHEERLGDLARGFEERLVCLQQEADSAAHRLNEVEETLRVLQQGLEDLAGTSQAAARRLDTIEGDLRSTNQGVARLRDEGLPAVSRRADVLVDRLAEEIEEIASLLERALRREPLPLPQVDSLLEQRLAHTLHGLRHLADDPAGDPPVDDRLDLFDAQGPVLVLGSGRGQLLQLLAEAGIEASGVEADGALAAAARRRGLKVIEGELRSVLADLSDGSWQTVFSQTVVERSTAPELAAVLQHAHRLLCPGGRLVLEALNTANLRVAATVFWRDPCNLRPLHPTWLRHMVAASGFEVESTVMYDPFPDRELFSRGQGQAEDLLAERLGGLECRLDELLNGDRRLRICARRPGPESDSPSKGEDP